MEIEEIRRTMETWDDMLTSHQKKNIHFFSMRNFIFYYNQLPNEVLKEKVLQVISSYMHEIESRGFDFHGIQSYELANMYLDKISDTYVACFGFKYFLKFKYMLIFSIIGDGIVYLLLHNKINFYFPVITLILMIYFFYTKIFYEKKKKAFGIFY